MTTANGAVLWSTPALPMVVSDLPYGFASFELWLPCSYWPCAGRRIDVHGPLVSASEVAPQLALRTLVGTMLKRRVHCIARDLAHLS